MKNIYRGKNGERGKPKATNPAGSNGRSLRENNTTASGGPSSGHGALFDSNQSWSIAARIHTDEGDTAQAPDTMFLRGGGPERSSNKKRGRAKENPNLKGESDQHTQKRQREVYQSDPERGTTDTVGDANTATTNDYISGEEESNIFDGGEESSSDLGINFSSVNQFLPSSMLPRSQAIPPPQSLFPQQSSISNMSTSSSSSNTNQQASSSSLPRPIQQQPQLQLPVQVVSASPPQVDNRLYISMPQFPQVIMPPSVPGLPPIPHQQEPAMIHARPGQPSIVNMFAPPPPPDSAQALQLAQFILLQQRLASQMWAFPPVPPMIPQQPFVQHPTIGIHPNVTASAGGIPTSATVAATPRTMLWQQQTQQQATRQQPPSAGGFQYEPPFMVMRQQPQLSVPVAAAPSSPSLPYASEESPKPAPAPIASPTREAIARFETQAVKPNPDMLMFLPEDKDRLSEYQILVRKHIEFFEATEADVARNVQGRKKQLHKGQVGLRCIHCYHVLPLNRHRRGSVYFPMKLLGIYQAAQNIATTHLSDSCICIPVSVKAELNRLREFKVSAGGGKKYWASTGEAKGLYETEQGLRLRPREEKVVEGEKGGETSPESS